MTIYDDVFGKSFPFAIGFDRTLQLLNRAEHLHDNTNYPPYNLIQVNNVQSVLEIALAGFNKKELKVYTEYGKLIIEGQKETKETKSEYVHQGLAQRSFTREWTLSDDVKIRDVQFKDGLLTVNMGKIVPEYHTRKDYL